MEIERKFLLVNPPEEIYKAPVEEIQQGYLALEENGTEVRIRKRAGQFLLTVKSAGNLERTEVEFAISQDQFAQLWPLTVGRRVEKKRFTFPLQEHLLEIDVFQGHLQGLTVVEVEFSSREAAIAFELPKWFGKELTNDSNYKNKNLARISNLNAIVSQT